MTCGAVRAFLFAHFFAFSPSSTFSTGKFGDLAGYSSAIVLAMIALLIGYERSIAANDAVDGAHSAASMCQRWLRQSELL
jgi:hypothetical protein